MVKTPLHRRIGGRQRLVVTFADIKVLKERGRRGKPALRTVPHFTLPPNDQRLRSISLPLFDDVLTVLRLFFHRYTSIFTHFSSQTANDRALLFLSTFFPPSSNQRRKILFRNVGFIGENWKWGGRAKEKCSSGKIRASH